MSLHVAVLVHDIAFVGRGVVRLIISEEIIHTSSLRLASGSFLGVGVLLLELLFSFSETLLDLLNHVLELQDGLAQVCAHGSSHVVSLTV